MAPPAWLPRGSEPEAHPHVVSCRIDERLDVEIAHGEACAHRLIQGGQRSHPRSADCVAQRQHRRSDDRKRDLSEWDVVVTVEVHELIATERQWVEFLKNAAATEKCP